MHIRTKINYKKYFLLTIASTLLFCLFARSRSEIIGICIIYVATIINHWMMMKGVEELVAPHLHVNDDKPLDKTKMAFLFVGKMFVLFGGIYLGVLFMGNRVIIPVLNYVTQIFLLIYSLSNKADI